MSLLCHSKVGALPVKAEAKCRFQPTASTVPTSPGLNQNQIRGRQIEKI